MKAHWMSFGKGLRIEVSLSDLSDEDRQLLLTTLLEEFTASKDAQWWKMLKEYAEKHT